MNGKQQYYGNLKKRSSEAQDKTLENLYRESETNKDVEAFLDANDNIDEEALKEKPSAKKKRIKAEHRAATGRSIKHVLKRVFLIAFLLGIGAAAVFVFLQTGGKTTEIGDVKKDETEADELYYSNLTGKEVSKKETVNQAATCIMIENSPAARPQSGLNEAGVIYEAIAEGGITRFLAIFQEAKPNYIGPVRSVRLTFVEMAKPYHCSIAHVGGSDNALRLIRGNSAFRDIDQFYNAKYYWRIRSRYSPHNVYTRFSMLDELNYSKGYRTSDFNGFARVKPDTAPEKPEKKANKITIGMGNNDYSPVYTYYPDTNKYLRSYVRGGAHYNMTESGVKTQLAPDVVVAMRVSAISRSSEAKYADYTTTGTGDAYIFQNGGVISARWERKDKDSELKFVDTSGNDIQLNRGQTWITLYPSNNKVTWE